MNSPALGVFRAQGFCISRAAKASDEQVFTALHCLEGVGSGWLGELQVPSFWAIRITVFNCKPSQCPIKFKASHQ